MHNKLKRRPYYLLVLGVPVLLIAYGLSSLYQQPVRFDVQIPSPNYRQATPHKPTIKAADRGLPAQLDIPKLNVKSAVSYTGITKSGAMETPNNAIDVGWYKYGPLPGNTGSAVMAGHVDGSRGEPGVFSSLEKLQPGDTLSVTDQQGRLTSFTVRESRIYGQDDQPAEAFNSSSGSHLNLITCTGDWDAGQHHFLKRLVVFTDRSY